jgi:hypothetical protein
VGFRACCRCSAHTRIVHSPAQPVLPCVLNLTFAIMTSEERGRSGGDFTAKIRVCSWGRCVLPTPLLAMPLAQRIAAVGCAFGARQSPIPPSNRHSQWVKAVVLVAEYLSRLTIHDSTCPVPRLFLSGHQFIIPNNYTGRLTCAAQVCPASADVALFASVHSTAGIVLESGYDFLRLFDSPSAGSAQASETMVVEFTGVNTLSSTGYMLGGYGRCLTVRFTSDGSGTAAGGSIWIQARSVQVGSWCASNAGNHLAACDLFVLIMDNTIVKDESFVVAACARV